MFALDPVLAAHDAIVASGLTSNFAVENGL